MQKGGETMLDFEGYTRAKCPFYVQEEGCRVTCEGLVSHFTCQRFDTKTERKRYAARFCAGCYGSCRMYQLLLQKYE